MSSRVVSCRVVPRRRVVSCSRQYNAAQCSAGNSMKCRAVLHWVIE